MLTIPYYDDEKILSKCSIIRTVIKEKKLIIPQNALEVLEMDQKNCVITKGTVKEEFFLFKYNNFDMFWDELNNPAHEEIPHILRIRRHFIASSICVNFDIDQRNLSLCNIPLYNIYEYLCWAFQDCEVEMIYNKNMVYKAISVRKNVNK